MNVKAFLRFLRARTPSAETQRAYRQDLEKYQAFLRSKGLRVNQAKPSTITEFIDHLSNAHGTELAPATISRRLAVLSAFYEFLRDNSDGNIRNPVERVKRPKVDNEAFRAVDEATLAKLANGVVNLRDKAIILTLLYSGLRLAELCQLNKDTITTVKRQVPGGPMQYFGKGEVIGKGRKRRQFLIGPAALDALRDYLKESRMKDTNTALFLSGRGKRISSRAVQGVLDRWCKRLGIPHIHPHQLRHSFATRSVNAGMSSAVLQEILGHKNLSTSQRYFRVKPERLAREYHAAMEFIRQCSQV